MPLLGEISVLYKYTFPTTKRSGLIRTGGSTWFKIEDEPVKIEIGCIAEGVAYMLAIFYAFNMKHPVPLNGGRQARVFQAKGVLMQIATTLTVRLRGVLPFLHKTLFQHAFYGRCLFQCHRDCPV